MKAKINDPNKSFYCPIKQHGGKALINCPACKKYPCTALEVQHIHWLNANVPNESYKWIRIRGKMVIIEKTDGTLKVEDKFDLNNPSEKQLKDVHRVHYVTKTYEKKVTLVPLKKDKK